MNPIYQQIIAQFNVPNCQWQEHAKSGVLELKGVIAEQKGFLSSKKLTYTAQIKCEVGSKEVIYFESLSEKSAGLGVGGGEENGFGFEKSSYNTFKKEPTLAIEKQVALFGQKYQYRFNIQELPRVLLKVTSANNYTLRKSLFSLK